MIKAPKTGHYPQGLMSIIYNLENKLVYDCLLISNNNERNCLIEQMDQLSKGDILVLDRGYFSYLLLYKAIEKSIHLICRLQFGTMNKEIKTFYNSNLNDAIINYSPSATIKTALKQQGYHIDYKDIKLRLIKYQIEDEIYICATTLIGEQYPANEFPSAYHARWGIEEIYKISKEFINVEGFHSKMERGVKQELYAHVLLLNIARIFELEADSQIPLELNQDNFKEKSENIRESYWQGFCGKIQEYKINFKNCLLVIGRCIEKLIIPIEEKLKDLIYQILISISDVRQKIRIGRHYLRQSMKPCSKWRAHSVYKSTRKVA